MRAVSIRILNEVLYGVLYAVGFDRPADRRRLNRLITTPRPYNYVKYGLVDFILSTLSYLAFACLVRNKFVIAFGYPKTKLK